MTDDEIINKLLEIQVREGISQRKMAKRFKFCLTTLNAIMSRKKKIFPARRNILTMTIMMYEKGLI